MEAEMLGDKWSKRTKTLGTQNSEEIKADLNNQLTNKIKSNKVQENNLFSAKIYSFSKEKIFQ